MNRVTTNIISWLIVLWTTKVFLLSLPYKFTGHPDTQHIFGAIGTWMSDVIGSGIGHWFIEYGAYAVGTAELITAVVLLSPALFWLLQKNSLAPRLPQQSIVHGIGGLMASAIMSGAVFFHLFTPLGIQVLHEGKSDNGSLFYAAVSILLLGLCLFAVNFMQWQASNRIQDRQAVNSG